MSAGGNAPVTKRGAQLADPHPYNTNAWHMLGYLQSRLEHKGRLTKADWNEAAAAARLAREVTDGPEPA
jgi:hypothetical protein